MELIELIALLQDVVKSGNQELLHEIFEDNYSIDIATALLELEDEEIEVVIELMQPEKIAAVLEESDEVFQKRILGLIDLDMTVQVFRHMSTDDIADVVGLMGISKRKELFKMMKAQDSSEIQMLLGFDEDTAGGIMTTRYIALKKELNVKDAILKIKGIGPKTEVIETIFVVGRYNQLVGVADLRDILVAEDDVTLEEIMNENIISVLPDTDQEEVSLVVSKYDLKALPVINRKGAILGIITTDDVIDVIVEEHTEDLLMLAGVSKDEKVGSNVLVSIKRRLPWLCVNLFTALISSFTVGLFEGVIVQVVALAATMPMVTGMGGNAGSQVLSVVIRSIALGEIDIKKDWKFVFNEVAVGLFNGLVIGTFAGIIIYLKYNNLFLSLIILGAMLVNLVIASIFGFLVPLVLKQLKLDPAVSSSIFLTASTDIGGFFIFLGLAKLFLPYLL